MNLSNFKPTAWHIEHFPNLGRFVVTTDGCKLFKVEEGVIILYNKNRKEQVEIDIDALHQLVRAN